MLDADAKAAGALDEIAEGDVEDLLLPEAAPSGEADGEALLDVVAER